MDETVAFVGSPTSGVVRLNAKAFTTTCLRISGVDAARSSAHQRLVLQTEYLARRAASAEGRRSCRNHATICDPKATDGVTMRRESFASLLVLSLLSTGAVVQSPASPSYSFKD